MKLTLATLAACGLCAAAHAQVVINEVWENPPNGGDGVYEYIELYGPPNYDLTGYAVALAKGEEIDEAFSLDGFSTGPNGFFVVHASTATGFSGINQWGSMIVNPAYNPGQNVTRSNRPYLNGAPFLVAHIPTTDTAGKLANDGSSTYLLVRRRPAHVLSTAGESVYLPGYVWRKDVDHDADSDSRLDFGDEPSAEGAFEPIQIVDEVAWSNDGEQEYVTPGRGLMASKISATPGFNPDAISRIRYLGENPLVGWTIEDGEAVRTTAADESWVYAETVNVTPGTANYGLYKDFIEFNQRTFGAPTDPEGGLYDYQPGLQNPLESPFFRNTDAYAPGSGTQRFEPFSVSGLRMTPGAFNDRGSAPNANPNQPVPPQFRFMRGDFDFNGLVDCDDRALIAASLGRTLDDTTVRTRTNADGQEVAFDAFARQTQDFNALLAMIRMDLTDGSTGDWTTGRITDAQGRITAWGGAVTTLDLAAFDAELDVSCNPADFNGDGSVNVTDLLAYLSAFRTGDASADLTGDDRVNVSDLLAYLNLFRNG